MSGNLIFIFCAGRQVWDKMKVKVDYYTVVNHFVLPYSNLVYVFLVVTCLPPVLMVKPFAWYLLSIMKHNILKRVSLVKQELLILLKAPAFTFGFKCGSCYSIFSFMCMLCRSLFFLLAIVLSVLLRYTASDYHFGFIKLFIYLYARHLFSPFDLWIT